jgi:uncharacterized membrane protein (UPF0127 family)
MTRVVGARMVGLCVAMAIGGCASADDEVTSVTDSVAPVESQDLVEASPGATNPPLTVSPTAVSPTTTSRPDVATKDVRTRAADLVGEGVSPEGFSTIVAEVTSADGEVCTVCLWLADVADERVRGLMGVTDLGDAVGMAFVFDDPGEGAFVMIGTPTPLSIGWFDVDGGFVSALDMEPCSESDSSQCKRYRPDGPYVVAIEMLQGELDAIGIGADSTIELLADTESAECGAIG